MVRLPLFPLQIVVFPDEEVPLHIFEPRYRQLVRDMTDVGEAFGIALLRRGGRAEETHEIGCTVRIEQTEQFPDGRYNIICRGEQRFRIIERLDAAPYWIAEVELLEDPADAESGDAYAACEETSALYRQHLGMTLALQNSWQRRFRLPSSPMSLVHHIGAQVEAPPSVKQEVLKAETAVEQLRLLARLLRATNRQLADRVGLHQRQRWSGLGVAN